MSSFIDKTKYKKRVIDKTIDDYLEVAGAICIEGPKWCGKTFTSSFHSNSDFMVGDPKDNFSNRALANLDPSFVLQGKTPRMIDEWQEVQSLWDAVRYEVDKRGKKGQFVLTGSSTPKRKGILHSGAGRIVRLRMNTMSLYETGDSTGQVSLKDLCENKLSTQMVEEKSILDIATYIIRGGWPQNIDIPSSKSHLMPKAYIDTLIHEDIQKLDDSIEYNEHKFELLLKSLAKNESTTVSDSTLLKDIIQNDQESMSRNTIAKYLDIMKRLFILNNQEPYSPSFRSSLRVKQNEKRHFTDPAMACAILNLTPTKLLQDLNTFGFLFEALVEHDLSIYVESFNAKLFHYQDYKKNEIDAVIELDDGHWCGVEIKLGSNQIEEAAKNLKRINSALIAEGNEGAKSLIIIVGKGNVAYKREDGVLVVPITALKD